MKKRSQENSWGLFSSLPVEITAERNLDGNQMDVNVLSSVYEKNIEKLLTEAVAQENTGDIGIFYAKKDATALIPAGVQFPIRIQEAMASTPIIHKFSEKVNMQISDVPQSQQFMRWFGDWQNHPEDASKVVNDDGTPKVVYHGTNADFTVFESDNGTYWFSESEDYAEAMAEDRGGDGKVMSVYLDMKNPYYAKLEPGKFTDPTYEAPIIRAAKEGGHDGIIIENDTDSDIESETFYVVFSPTQIKSATDNIGTFDRNNPDIRYQKRGGNGADKGTGYFLRKGAEADVDQALTDLSRRDDVYLTESSPSIIATQKGVSNLPMLMKASHIRENVYTEAEAKKLGLKVNKYINYHGLGKELFLKIIGGLDDVTLAYRGTKNATDPSRRENYFLLISQYKDADGNTVNVPVYINERGQYNRVFIDTNKIATVFGRDNFNEYINRELKNGNLVRIKNKSAQASERTAPIAGGYSGNAFTDTTISQNDQSVNSSISENEKNDTPLSDTQYQKRSAGRLTDAEVTVLALESAAKSNVEEKTVREMREKLDAMKEHKARAKELLLKIRDAEAAENISSEDRRRIREMKEERKAEVNRADNARTAIERLATGKIGQSLITRKLTALRRAKNYERDSAVARAVSDERKKTDAAVEELRSMTTTAARYKAEASTAQSANEKLRTVIEAYKAEISSAKADAKATADWYRAERDRDVAATREKYLSRAEAARETRERTELKRKIVGVAKELSGMLLKNDRRRNIKIDLQAPVAEALSILDIYDTGSAGKIAKINAELEQLYAKPETVSVKNRISELLAYRDRLEASGESTAATMSALLETYKAIGRSGDDAVRTEYSEDVYNLIDSIRDRIGDTPLYQMDAEMLRDVYDVYGAILHAVRESNKDFARSAAARTAKNGEAAIAELRLRRHRTGRYTALDSIKSAAVETLKPIYFFDWLDSGTLSKLYDDIQRGEGNWGHMIADARTYLSGISLPVRTQSCGGTRGGGVFRLACEAVPR